MARVPKRIYPQNDVTWKNLKADEQKAIREGWATRACTHGVCPPWQCNNPSGGTDGTDQ